MQVASTTVVQRRFSKSILLVLELAYAVAVTVMFGIAYSVPFPQIELYFSLMYWIHVVNAISVIVLAVSLVSLGNVKMPRTGKEPINIFKTRNALITLMFVNLGFAIFQAFPMIVLIIGWIGCDINVQCATSKLWDEKMCGGAPGVDTGASIPYLITFSVSLIEIVIEIAVFYVAYQARRGLVGYTSVQTYSRVGSEAEPSGSKAVSVDMRGAIFSNPKRNRSKAT
jgi:hypothetical protein